MRQTKEDMKKPGNRNSNARDPRYDCLRAVAVMAIIMVHAMPVETVSPRQWLSLIHIFLNPGHIIHHGIAVYMQIRGSLTDVIIDRKSVV